jgi:nucleoside 2-deoxyribosyltransferase
LRIYLSGAIEHSADEGRGWRRRLAVRLEDLGHGVYDPAADDRKDLEDEERLHFRRWKVEDPGRFAATVRRIIAWDLAKIERESDALVAYWDEAAARGGGTAAEITLAYRLGKPVYLVLGMSRSEASGWVLACAERVFADTEELLRFLERRRDPGAGPDSGKRPSSL